MSTETKALAQAKMIGKIKSLSSWIVADRSQYQGLNSFLLLQRKDKAYVPIPYFPKVK